MILKKKTERQCHSEPVPRSAFNNALPRSRKSHSYRTGFCLISLLPQYLCNEFM